MRDWREQEIGEHTYELKPLGAIQGQRVLTKVLNVLGGAAGGFSGDDPTEAIAGILGNLDETTLEFISDAFGRCTRVVNGAQKPLLVKGTDRAIFDEHFATNYGELIEWLMVSFRMNYADFFDAARRDALLKRLGVGKQTKSPSTSPDTSTGSSGES